MRRTALSFRGVGHVRARVPSAPPGFSAPPDYYWPMDGADLASALVATAGGVDLTSSGAGISLSAGASPRGGNAVVFDGSGNTNASLIALVPSLLIPPFTLGMWVRKDSSFEGHIVGARLGAGGSWVVAPGATTSWNPYFLTSAQGVSNTTNGWGWVVMRAAAGAGPQLILNDNLAQAVTRGEGNPWTGEISGNTGLVFGCNHVGWEGGRKLAGAIADIVGWNRRLDDAELTATYTWIQTQAF